MGDEKTKWEECTRKARVSHVDASLTGKQLHHGLEFPPTTSLIRLSSSRRRVSPHLRSVSLSEIATASPRSRASLEAKSSESWRSSERTSPPSSDSSWLSPEFTDSRATTATPRPSLPPGGTTPRRLTLSSEQR